MLSFQYILNIERKKIKAINEYQNTSHGVLYHITLLISYFYTLILKNT